MDHALFSTVKKIKSLSVKGRTTYLQGIFVNGRLALVYSPEGLNNASNAKGCCCCGGAEIRRPARSTSMPWPTRCFTNGQHH